MFDTYKKSYFLFLFFLAVCTSVGAQEKTAVFIIGMGRSGTSCTAGVLNILGMEMGSPLAPPGKNNEKGKFEHLPTTGLMQPMLKEIDAIWCNPRLVDWDTHPKKDEFKNKIKKHISKHFGAHTFFGIKNPEITVLLPLFTQAAKELGYTPKIIMVLRHPDETNASMNRSLSTAKEYYRSICIAYACVFKYSQGFDLHVVYFNDLIYKTEQTVAALRKFLPQLKEYKTVQTEITQFIDEGLKHYNTPS